MLIVFDTVSRVPLAVVRVAGGAVVKVTPVFIADT